MYMEIVSIDYYRDCSTAGVFVSIDGSPEQVEYLIHGHNWDNARFDVTRDGWSVQNYPSNDELKELSLALGDFKHSEKYQGWQQTADEIAYLEKEAHRLSGMVDVFRYWLKSQENPPTKAIVPPKEDVVEIVTTQLSKQLADMYDREILGNMQCLTIRDGKFIFTPMPKDGFIKLEKTNEEE